MVPPGFGPFAVHSQWYWARFAADTRHPAVYRVMGWAFARRGQNGHARFRRGELASLLGGVNRKTGEVCPMHRSNLRRLIADAVELDLIDKVSESRCLVVNPDHVVGGGEGKPDDPCPVHSPRRRR